MPDCQNEGGRWPPQWIMQRALMVEDTGKIPFVDTEAAARYLALSPHSRIRWNAIARSGAARPSTNSGKFVRYAVADLEAWAAGCRHSRTSGSNARVY